MRFHRLILSSIFLSITNIAHASYKVCAGSTLYERNETYDTVFTAGEKSGLYFLLQGKKTLVDTTKLKDQEHLLPYSVLLKEEKILSTVEEKAKTTVISSAIGILKQKGKDERNSAETNVNERVICIDVQIFAPGP